MAMKMQAYLLLSGIAGVALASHGDSKNYFLHPDTDPKWDENSVQDDKTYSSDYVKDSGNASTKGSGNASTKDSGSASAKSTAKATSGSQSGSTSGAKTSSSAVPSSCASPHTPSFYKEKCEEIAERCKYQKEALKRARADRIKRAQEVHDFEKDELADAEGHLSDANDDVAKQKKEVKEAKMDVKEAKEYRDTHKHCCKDLKEAEEELAQLEAEPNESPEDIDAECKAKKKVLEMEKCCIKLRKAEETLGGARVDHKGEKSEYSGDKEAAADAAKDVDHQEDTFKDAQDALDAAMGKDLDFAKIDAQCKADIDALKQHADECVAEAKAQYKKQQDVLDGKEEAHDDALDTVADQKGVVAEEKMNVAKARKYKDEHEHCPGDLEKAREELAELESKPNQTPEDIEAECALKKKILGLEKCVDTLIEAEETLAGAKDEHAEEGSELAGDKSDAKAAGKAVKYHKKTLQDYKADLDQANTARAVLDDCKCCSDGEGARKSSAAGASLAALVLIAASMVERMLA